VDEAPGELAPARIGPDGRYAVELVDAHDEPRRIDFPDAPLMHVHRWSQRGGWPRVEASLLAWVQLPRGDWRVRAAYVPPQFQPRSWEPDRTYIWLWPEDVEPIPGQDYSRVPIVRHPRKRQYART
jgi:hypothetical protein